jgi:hypothetical protein
VVDDDDVVFTSEMLRAWKGLAESKAAAAIEVTAMSRVTIPVTKTSLEDACEVAVRIHNAERPDRPITLYGFNGSLLPAWVFRPQVPTTNLDMVLGPLDGALAGKESYRTDYDIFVAKHYTTT